MSWLDDYRRVKTEVPDSLLLWRVGDFYEALDEDAVALAGALDIILTTAAGNAERTPRAGVPHTQIEWYVARLVAGGRKVAVVTAANVAPIRFGEPIAPVELAVPVEPAAPAAPVARQLRLF